MIKYRYIGGEYLSHDPLNNLRNNEKNFINTCHIKSPFIPIMQ